MYAGIQIYHYDNASKRFVYHSIIKDIYISHKNSALMQISSNGLILVTQVPYYNILHFYVRNSLTQQFVFKTTSNIDLLNYVTYSNSLAISYYGDMIITVNRADPTKRIRLYSCGISVIQMVQPPNGKELIYQTSKNITQTLQILNNITTPTTPNIPSNSSTINSTSNATISLNVNNTEMKQFISQNNQDILKKMENLQRQYKNQERTIEVILIFLISLVTALLTLGLIYLAKRLFNFFTQSKSLIHNSSAIQNQSNLNIQSHNSQATIFEDSTNLKINTKQQNNNKQKQLNLHMPQIIPSRQQKSINQIQKKHDLKNRVLKKRKKQQIQKSLDQVFDFQQI